MINRDKQTSRTPLADDRISQQFVSYVLHHQNRPGVLLYRYATSIDTPESRPTSVKDALVALATETAWQRQQILSQKNIMARSADALQRRALKRGRNLEEQQRADAKDAARGERRTNKKQITITTTTTTTTEEEKGQEEVVSKALTEPGAWQCPSCGNHNFASRYICNSKTCNESKPESAIRASQANRNGALGPKSWTTTRLYPPNKKPKRHDPETSKFIDWSKPQASPSQIEHNQLLRQRLKDNDPTLTGEDLERAQILVARDDRKQQKKMKRYDSDDESD